MTETTTACIRGCTMYARHLDECQGVNDETCRGCLPRRANHGHLCDTCHRRLELMLTDAPTVIRWLTGNIEKRRSSEEQMTWRGDRPELGTGDHEPLNAEVYDLRELLRDRLALWVDDWCEHKGLMGPGQHTPDADAEYLLRWLPGICSLEWIGDWWTEMAETMRLAHTLAPWRPTVRRIPRVACPGCDEVNLVIFGGESDVTCQSCGIMMTEERFALWETVLREQEEAEVS